MSHELRKAGTSPLPATLRFYRRLSAAAGPLTPVLLKRRLKQGKEDPARIDERRGITRHLRPAGPLVWIHGASVGEVLAAAALIERLRALEYAHSAYLGYRDLGRPSSRSGFRRISFTSMCPTTRRASWRAFSIIGSRVLRSSSNRICGPI